MRWRKYAATNPEPRTAVCPSVPRRVHAASRSRKPSAASTERSWAARIRAAVASSAVAHSTLTDFGAEKVTSNPGTRSLRTKRGSVALVRGSRAARTAPLLALNLSLEAKLPCPGTTPAPRPLPLARVVVVSAPRDRVEVVGLLALAELSDRDHLQTCRPSGLGVQLSDLLHSRTRGPSPLEVRIPGGCNCVSGAEAGGERRLHGRHEAIRVIRRGAREQAVEGGGMR